MTTQKVDDYLTKQLFISKNIVTYRSLSREFGIHVNVAKNELAAFHVKTAKSPDQPCSATYLVSGEVKSLKKTKNVKHVDIDMDIDYGFTPTQTSTTNSEDEQEEGEGGGEVVVQIQMTIVTEDKLEDTKAKYHKLKSVHVYSLSPSPIRDADLLCATTQRIREVDSQKGVELAKIVGRIIGEEVKMKEGGTKGRSRPTPAAQSVSKPKAGSSTLGLATTAVKAEESSREAVKDEPKKTKAAGKLNFFAPKAQAQDKAKEKEREPKAKTFFGTTKTAAHATTETVPSPPPREIPKEVEPTKRGTKRKSTAAILSGSEEENNSISAAPSGLSSRRSSKPPSARSSPQPTKAMSKLRLHKKAILSDGEGESETPRRKTRKKLQRNASPESDEDDNHDSEAAKQAANALKSMMDIDDDQVEKVSRKAKVEPLRQEEEESEPEPTQERAMMIKNEDVDMSDGEQTKIKPKTRKKRAKKVVPVGRNGLKKRRMTKSRTRIDEKGYMVTEDYSSYESVDEEEAERSVPATKGNGDEWAAVNKESTTMAAPETAVPENKSAAAPNNGDTKSKTTAKAASSSIKRTAGKGTAGPKGGQKQGTLATFFGATRSKK